MKKTVHFATAALIALSVLAAPRAFDADLRPVAHALGIALVEAGALPNPDFSGWYIQAAWALTVETRNWNPVDGVFSRLKSAKPLELRDLRRLTVAGVAANRRRGPSASTDTRTQHPIPTRSSAR